MITRKELFRIQEAVIQARDLMNKQRHKFCKEHNCNIADVPDNIAHQLDITFEELLKGIK